MNRIKLNIANKWELVRNNLWKVIFLLISIFASWGYFNQQAFINLWLTPDQQAVIYFNDLQYDYAAEKFTNKQWLAYSLYAQQEFDQAAQVWSQGESYNDLFGQANALAHSGDYSFAAKLYKSMLKSQPGDERIQKNLAIVVELATLAKNKKGKPGKGNALRMDKNKEQQEKTAEEESSVELPQKLLTDGMWLEQVKANPTFFLQKKFALENDNDQQQARKKTGASQ